MKNISETLSNVIVNSKTDPNVCMQNFVFTKNGRDNLSPSNKTTHITVQAEKMRFSFVFAPTLDYKYNIEGFRFNEFEIKIQTLVQI